MTWDGKLRAPNYDKLEWTNREEYNSLLVKACNLKSKYHVCDVGTGTGKVAEELAKYCRKVTGVDSSEERTLSSIHNVSNFFPVKFFFKDALTNRSVIRNQSSLTSER